MYQKITFTLPEQVVTRMTALLPKGEKSKFAAEAIEEKLTYMILQERLNKIDSIDKRLAAVRAEFGTKHYSTETLLKNIKKGRK